MHFDAHQKPRDELKALYKRYQKATPSELAEDEDVVDFGRGLTPQQLRVFETQPFHVQDQRSDSLPHSELVTITGQAKHEFKSKILPGLSVIPSLLSLDEQRLLMQKLVHRDLSNPDHLTNVHFHHRLVYPGPEASFFDYSPDDQEKILPRTLDHKAISMRKFFEKKLRWMTLGGQYNWSDKVYPDETPPPFPPDLQAMLRRFFPATTAEAAIVNFYSPGDVLSLHRDVAEHCDNGLISLSIGCDGIFLIALDETNDCASQSLVLRLRSGDAVYMDGKSRFAWHGVPAVLANTCPVDLQAFPASRDTAVATMADWEFWMRHKRINLNVRQMWNCG